MSRTQRLWLSVGLALTAGTSLALEILDTRLLSVLTWYSFAFLVISMGLFGLTVGALRVYFRSEKYEGEALLPSVCREARRLALAIPISYALLLIVPLQINRSLTTGVLFAAFAMIIALPFIPAGAVIAAVLTRSGLPIGRLYFIDLIGAALGALLVPALLSVTDGGTAALSLAVAAAAAAVAFAIAGADRRALRRSTLLLIGLAVLVGVDAFVTDGLVPIWVKGKIEQRSELESVHWSSHARIVVRRPEEMRVLFWGRGKKCQWPRLPQRRILIDGEAETAMLDIGGDSDKLEYLLCDVTNAAQYIRPVGPMAIIGVGGGRDVLSALRFDHDRILGIELNEDLLALVRGPLAGPAGLPVDDPRIELVHDEGRSYLTRTDERFALIQASMTDTWAATGAGAHALAENALYTVEAWHRIVERLYDGGVFTVSRWYLPDAPDETRRMLATAIAVLIERGAGNPRDHLALITSTPVATLILCRDPLTAAEVERLEFVSESLGFDPVVLPGRPVEDPFFEQLLSSGTREELDRRALTPDIDYRPVSDDRPFFFNLIRLRSFLRGPQEASHILDGNRLATTTVVLAGLVSLGLAVGMLVFPLARRRRATERPAGLVPGLAYFTVIGVAFLLVEIGLLLKLSLVLGHPSYSLLVVLPGLIAATGLGAWASDRLPLDRAPWDLLVAPLIAAAIVVLTLLLPGASGEAMRWTLPWRIALCLGLTAGPGLFLGLAFPAGMRIATRAGLEHETPWFWGMNGVGSVIAGSLALILALAFGITRLMWIAAALYLLLVPCVLGLRRASRR